MKTLFIATIIAVSAFMLLSCEEDVTPSHVQGHFECDACSADFNADGSLSKKGANFYGYCEKEGDTFKFEVGHADSSHVSGGSEFYLFFMGIEGPPVEGVFDGGEEPNDEKFTNSGFQVATIKNVNQFSVTSDDSDTCEVEMWAVPAGGELTPTTEYAEGLRKFDHYVKIDCNGINVTATNSQDAELRSFFAEFYFSNC